MLFSIPALVMFYGMSQKRTGNLPRNSSLADRYLCLLEYYKAGYVELRLAMLIAAGFVIGGYFGGLWAQQLPEVLLRRICALFLAILAAKLAFSK